MSDGPHKSLPLPPHWKKFAERIYKPAFSILEMTDAATDALLRDFSTEVPHGVLEELREVLYHEQPTLFGEQGQQLETLQKQADGYPLRRVFLENVANADKTHSSDDMLIEAIRRSVLDLMARRARQIEEHYYRQPKKLEDVNVRERIESTCKELDEATIAHRLLGDNQIASFERTTKQHGVDDGVPL